MWTKSGSIRFPWEDDEMEDGIVKMTSAMKVLHIILGVLTAVQ